jgi:predicted nucleic acid-binding Zn ribbon protein
VTGEWRAEGTELARAFVRDRTGVEAEVPLTRVPRLGTRRRGQDEAAWSAAGPDVRDPASAAAVVEQVVRARGWQDQVAVHAVTGRWAQIVGPAVAEHATVESFADGALLVRCDSTAWATQMRMLVPELLRRLSDEAGPGVVRSVVVKGPDAPSWVRGPRRVKGRGPRDTYG